MNRLRNTSHFYTSNNKWNRKNKHSCHRIKPIHIWLSRTHSMNENANKLMNVGKLNCRVSCSKSISWIVNDAVDDDYVDRHQWWCRCEQSSIEYKLLSIKKIGENGEEIIDLIFWVIVCYQLNPFQNIRFLSPHQWWK